MGERGEGGAAEGLGRDGTERRFLLCLRTIGSDQVSITHSQQNPGVIEAPVLNRHHDNRHSAHRHAGTSQPKGRALQLRRMAFAVGADRGLHWAREARRRHPREDGCLALGAGLALQRTGNRVCNAM